MLPRSIQVGEHTCVSINLTNVGFAAPYRNMDVFIALQNTQTKKYGFANIKSLRMV